jgi:glycosyltransferase involved in cell wall biosynthesis
MRVGVVAGTRLPGNVRTLLSNIQRLLSKHPKEFDLDIVLSENVNAPEGYNQVDPGFGEPTRALETLRTLTCGVTHYAQRQDIDLLFQVTKFPLHGCATTIAGHRTGTPVLTRFAGDNFREFRLSSGVEAVKTFSLNNVLGRVPIHLSDRVIVLGPAGREVIASRNGDVPISEIPQPVNREQFSPVSSDCERALATELGIPTSQRVLLTVGRLTERKGMRTVVETAKQLTTCNRPFRWYVLGEGPMKEELVATPGIKPLGRVNFEQIADYYRVADLVVHPSQVEGLPNVLLEATACGTPTVARDVGDCKLVASATFEDDSQLPALLTQDHDPVALGDRFNEKTLSDQYAKVLTKTASDTDRKKIDDMKEFTNA